MITRQFARRHARALACTRHARPQIQLRRTYASEVDGIEKSLQNSLRETHAIEGMLQDSSSEPIPRLDGNTFQQLDPATSKIAEKYSILQHQNATTGQYGAAVKKYYKPSEVLNNPPSPSAITPELLLASQAHMGHSTSLWNPMNQKYIYGVREGVHIISLEETAAHLRTACNVVSGVAERGGLILFAGTRKGQDRSVVEAAKRSKGYHLFTRWTPGSITNKEQILGFFQLKMVDEFDKDVLVNPEVLSKHPAVTPDLVVCLNPLENWVLLHECALNNIPTIGIIDTDANPTWVTYPIPANDDSLRCTNLIAGVLGRAGEAGQKLRVERTLKGDIPYDPYDISDSDDTGDLYKIQLDADKTHQYEVEYKDANGNPISPEDFKKLEREGIVVDDSMMTIYTDGDSGNPNDERPYYFDDKTGDAIQSFEPKTHAPVVAAREAKKISPPTGRRAPAPRLSEATSQDDAVAEADRLAEMEAVTSEVAGQKAQTEEKDAIEAANKVPDDGRQKKLDDEKREKSH